MHEALTIYFNGEKNAGVVLVILGLLSFAAAGFFFPARLGLRAFAITLAVFAFVEIAIGVGLYARTDTQVRGLIAQLDASTGAFAVAESVRMVRVQRTFVLVQYAELALILAAAVIAVALKTRPVASGVALGILLHAAALLAFDIVAERRGAVYLAEIRQLAG